jgi:hypothetical protein
MTRPTYALAVERPVTLSSAQLPRQHIGIAEFSTNADHTSAREQDGVRLLSRRAQCQMVLVTAVVGTEKSNAAPQS